MKAQLILLLLVAFIALETSAWTSEEKRIFRDWRKEFKKVYRNEAEEKEAMDNLLKNKQKIDAHNKLYEEGKVSYERGLFEYSDLSPIQMKKLLGGLRHPFVPSKVKRSIQKRETTKPPTEAEVQEAKDIVKESSFITKFVLIFIEFIGALIKNSS